MNHELVADVVIVGGGVAGSSLGAVLAQAGLGVTIFEREARFHDRVRGEGIMPWGVDEADRLGLLAILRDAGAIAVRYMYSYEDREMTNAFDMTAMTPSGHGGLDIYHPDLQDALLDHARRSGATVLRPARANVLRGGARQEISVTTEDGEMTIRARLVVGADGRTSAARRWAGVQTIHDPARYLIGGGLVEGEGLATDGFHVSGVDGWMMLYFPHRDRRGRAYIVCHDETARDLMGAMNRDRYIPTLARALPDGVADSWTLTGPVAFFPNADIWADRAAGNGIALIGDAAGANDPIIGQGLSLSFRDARELRDLLLDGSDWQAALAAYADRRDRYYQVVRSYALWFSALWVERGPEADARRERVSEARKRDPSAGGLLGLPQRGPDGVTLDEAARRRYFGEDN